MTVFDSLWKTKKRWSVPPLFLFPWEIYNVEIAVDVDVDLVIG